VKQFIVTCGLALLGLSTGALAEKDSYECTIEQYFELDIPMSYPKAKDGPMVRGYPSGLKSASPSGTIEYNVNLYAKGAIGKTFTVYPRSGIIAGNDPPRNDEAKRTVLDAGGGGQSYVQLSLWGPAVQLLRIVTWAPGDQKPFMLTRDTVLLAGTCR
jgi:hypothetical protein